MHDGGAHWSAWVSYLSFFRHVAKLPIDYSAWQHYERLAELSASRIVHAQFCVVSERPTTLQIDPQHRPHREDGPSHEWADGWRVWYWRGVLVPGRWIETRDLTAQEALSVANVEERRAACEILGWERVLDDLGARSLDEDAPEIGTLYECDLPDAPQSRFLKVRCGTGRTFVLPVPNTVHTAIAANAWTYDLPESAIRALQWRT
jgi:hypothetical protein